MNTPDRDYVSRHLERVLAERAHLTQVLADQMAEVYELWARKNLALRERDVQIEELHRKLALTESRGSPPACGCGCLSYELTCPRCLGKKRWPGADN
jgi:hypothetical protein